MPTATPTLASQVRAQRLVMGLSQDELARVLREQYGILTASKRMIQRWEAGVVPSRDNQVVLMAALGVGDVERVIADGTGARHVRVGAPFTPPPMPADAPVSDGRLPGVWLVRYQYWSTAREGVYVSQYHAVLEQFQLTAGLRVASIPADVSPRLELMLTLRGAYVTGTWDEWTDPTGHYAGEHRWGALQLRLSPDRRYMGGLWVGFGSGERINSGPWELVWLTGDTSPESQARYAHVLPDEPLLPGPTE